MKKSFNIFLVLVITFFTLPFAGNTVSADDKVFDNIDDGVHEIKIDALHATEDKPSGAAGFISKDAKLSIQDGEVKLTLTIPHNETAEVTGLQIEGVEPVVEEDEKAKYKTYKIDSLKSRSEE